MLFICIIVWLYLHVSLNEFHLLFVAHYGTLSLFPGIWSRDINSQRKYISNKQDWKKNMDSSVLFNKFYLTNTPELDIEQLERRLKFRNASFLFIKRLKVHLNYLKKWMLFIMNIKTLRLLTKLRKWKPWSMSI